MKYLMKWYDAWPRQIVRIGWQLSLLLALVNATEAQTSTSADRWIRPTDAQDASLWGIRNGIVFSLWPYGIETEKSVYGGGPRGLIRVGIERGGKSYLLNFLAVEPVIDGKMEFSEISPSRVDDVWGKLMWASDQEAPTGFYPTALSRGVISQPDPQNPTVEQLSLYVFMERFIAGAHPYLKLSIRSDRPQELCVEVFHRPDSRSMEFCNITATMGNYARLRQLHLKEGIVNAKELYQDYRGIDFVEKAAYPASQLIESRAGDLFAFATGDESIAALSAWPDDSLARSKASWRYRAPIKLTQYWRKEKATSQADLQLRVNGRYKYWSGGSSDATHYMAIPGGAAFENFELREKYTSGQKIYFGITEEEPSQIIHKFNTNAH